MLRPRSAQRYCCACRLQANEYRSTLSSHRFLLAVLGLLVVIFGIPVSSRAQSSTATLSGTVEDQSGALIAGANIALVNATQGSQRLATTNEEGRFVFPLLTPGNYSLTATGSGFAPQTRVVVLNINDQVSLRLTLTVGPLSQAVKIEDSAPLINESPAVATVVDRHFLENLPLNARSFQSLISLTPGVTIAMPSTSNPGQFSVNGQRTNANGFFVDGASANIAVSTGDLLGEQAAGSLPALTSFGGTNSLISMDALQEFSIQTSTFAPEFGRSPGAQISLVSRTGTRDFHGTLFEYFRNDKLDANDFFANRAGLPRAQLRHNQFGFVVGGPIVLPRFGEGGKALFDGRDHSFFFFSYEGLRLRQPQTVVTSVPSLRVRALAPANIRFLINAYPLPTGSEVGTTGRSPFTGVYSDQATLNATSFRLDHHFSSRFSLFGRFNNAPSQSVNRANAINQPPNNVVALDLRTTTLTIGSSQSISSQTFNEIRVNYSRSSGERSRTLDNYGGAVPVTVADLLPEFARGPHASAQITFFSTAYSVGEFNDNLQRQLNIIDNVSHTRGVHSFKFGFDYRRLTPIFQARDLNLVAMFTNEAAISSGKVSTGFVQIQKRTEPIFNNFSAYFQDVFRPGKRIAVTYGLRWDVNPPPSEAKGNIPFALTSSDPLTAKLAPPGTPLWKTTWNNFAPRAGISYHLFDDPGHELLLRGGFGLFYDLGNTQAGDAYTRGPFTASTPQPFITNQLYPLPITPASIPAYATNGTTVQTNASDPNLKQPYTWQWNVTLQQSLGTNQTLSASYVAAVGRRLIRPRLMRGNPNFQNLNFADNGSTSDYNALQLQFVRRLTKNFQALASYTWAHSLDDISDETATLTPVRGNSDFDLRHNFSAALQYGIPSKRKGWAGPLLRDWQTSLIVHTQSAYPLTPFTSSLSIVSGLVVTQWPNLKVGVPLYVSDPSVPGGRRINKLAFSSPGSIQGNVGRNSLRGFGAHQFDFALHRVFGLSEQFKLTFRGEAFNIFNHPNFGQPVGDLNNIFFGQSTQMLVRNLGGLSPIYQIGGPRSIQLALRLNF